MTAGAGHTEEQGQVKDAEQVAQEARRGGQGAVMDALQHAEEKAEDKGGFCSKAGHLTRSGRSAAIGINAVSLAQDVAV